MAHAAEYGKNMPYGMKVFYLFDSVKNHSDRVEHSAAYEQPQAPDVHNLQKRMNRYNNYPAHSYVANHRRLAEFFEVNGVERYADNSGAPDNSEQHPADSSAQYGNGNRGVCARYEEEYSVVVHYPEKRFGFRVRNRMIERAHTVEYNQARSENGAPDYSPRVVEYSREHYEYRRTRD